CRGSSSLDAREEQLLEGRHGRPSRCSDRRGLSGNLAPAEHLELLVGSQFLDTALGSGTSSRIDRQEGGTHRIVARRGKFERCNGAEESIRDLCVDTGTVARALIGAGRATV